MSTLMLIDNSENPRLAQQSPLMARCVIIKGHKSDVTSCIGNKFYLQEKIHFCSGKPKVMFDMLSSL